MQLLLWRHGIAEDVGPAGDDASRRLTPKGQKRTREVAGRLLTCAPRPGVILSSPKVRARQTAEIYAELSSLTVTNCPELAADGPDPLLRVAASRREAVVLMVGHEPVLSEAIARLCGGLAVVMKKAGCACVEWEPGGSEAVGTGRLLWLASPGVLLGGE